jgi:4-hydroxy 2-oxovalerate aldolase
VNVLGAAPDILEVTLRDGSYLIDFQFTAEDTVVIASALEAVGFRWIEVGHGLGLNASQAGKGRAAATDEEYLEAAARALKHARWGMFFIPGIGRDKDLHLAARYHMSFVRIGTNITEMDQAQPFFALAKELGFIVSYNAMKSYAISPAEFGRKAALARSWGADIFYLVDSAGGMYPDDVSEYLKAAKSESDIALGFHGHDNLSLVMANTLRAIECGVVLVDSSLQGMGRSAGNAITEVLVAILKQHGHLPDVDLKGTMDIGQGLILPLLRQHGMDPMAITAGYARFHSSFAVKVQRYAQEYQVDVRDLIVRLCQEDQISAPDALLERLSEEIAAEKAPRVISFTPFHIGTNEVRGPQALLSLLKEMRPRAVKFGKYSALNIVMGEEPQDQIIVSRNIQNTISHMIGSVTLTTNEQLLSVLDAVDGEVDVVLLDVDRKPFFPDSPGQIAQNRLKRSLLLTYLDSRVWVDAVDDQVVRLMGEVLDHFLLVIAGDHPKSRFLALRLAERRARVVIVNGHASPEATPLLEMMRQFSFDPDYLSVTYLNIHSSEATDCLTKARAVVVWPSGKPWFGLNEARHLMPGTFVLDAGIGSILLDGLEEARRRESMLIRVNIWPSLAAALEAAHESARVCKESLGWEILAGVPVVAGGAMGQRGDVVVDSVRQPTRVIGIADGCGGVLFSYGPEEVEQVRRVSEEIIRRRVMPRLSRER